MKEEKIVEQNERENNNSPTKIEESNNTYIDYSSGENTQMSLLNSVKGTVTDVVEKEVSSFSDTKKIIIQGEVKNGSKTFEDSFTVTSNGNRKFTRFLDYYNISQNNIQELVGKRIFIFPLSAREGYNIAIPPNRFAKRKLNVLSILFKYNLIQYRPLVKKRSYILTIVSIGLMPFLLLGIASGLHNFSQLLAVSSISSVLVLLGNITGFLGLFMILIFLIVLIERINGGEIVRSKYLNNNRRNRRRF